MCVVLNWASFLHIQVQEEGERRESAQVPFPLVSDLLALCCSTTVVLMRKANWIGPALG